VADLETPAYLYVSRDRPSLVLEIRMVPELPIHESNVRFFTDMIQN
jgi:hypothetical protein